MSKTVSVWCFFVCLPLFRITLTIYTVTSQRRIQGDGGYVGVDLNTPASVEVMSQRLKFAAIQAGFLRGCFFFFFFFLGWFVMIVLNNKP
jgi:hypothetical protein